MAFVYSCCFWFSLRLGGILIGIFSFFQALVLLIVLSLLHNKQQKLQDEIGNCINNMNLLFTKEYFENFRADPEKYITFGMCTTCLYIIFCLMFIYGAYKCSNMLMGAFIVAELVRLLVITLVLIASLLVLKQNTMDIGLLIGASVTCGFILLGMFYLWVCAANLPILINEMERDEQAATIARLQKLLQDNAKTNFKTAPFDTDNTGIFIISRNRNFKRKPFGDSTLRYGRWN